MNAKMLTTLGLVLAGTLLALGTAAVHAQGPPPPPPDGQFGELPPPPPGDGNGPPPPPPHPGGGDEHSRELLQQVMVARLSQELELNDEQTVLLVRRFLDYKDSGRKLRRERNDLARDLRELVKQGEAKSAEIDEKLNALVAADQKVADAKRELYLALSKDLPPVKKAKLYAFMQQFESDLRRMADEVRGRRGGGPDGGFGRGREFGPRGDGMGPDGPPPPPHGDGMGPDGPPPPARGEGPGGDRRMFDRRRDFGGEGPNGPGREHRGPGRPGRPGGPNGPGGEDGPPPPPPPPQRAPSDDLAEKDPFEVY